MSVEGWKSVLVLGGIRSGKSRFAESLVAGATGVRYVATAATHDDDPEWTARLAAHRERRPAGWTTEETGADPVRLAAVLADAKPDETLLVDDLGGWVTARLPGPDGEPGDDDPDSRSVPTTARPPAPDTAVEDLAAAIGACPGRVVLVSPEVGLSVVPATPVGRAFVDLLGRANQAVAAACDAVALVVAGQVTWLKSVPSRQGSGTPDAAWTRAVEAGAVEAGAVEAGAVEADAVHFGGDGADAVEAGADDRSNGDATVDLATLPPFVAMRITSPPTGPPAIEPGMSLPVPDEQAAGAASQRLAGLDLPGAGFGELTRVVGFAAGTQSRPVPEPWRSPLVLLLHGDHAGGVRAGTPDGDSARRAEAARTGSGPLGVLLARAGATLTVVDAPAAAPIEEGPALPATAVVDALAHGWRLATDAAADGADVLVIGACGAGAEAAAAAVLVATAGADPAAVLPRVVSPGSRFDDAAWMRRCGTVRDAMHRIRRSPRGAHDVLAQLGGGDIAIATGVLVGAATAKLPVLLDGPVGVAAAMVTRDLAAQARHWCLLPDHGRDPLLKMAADVLGLAPVSDLGLGLGEGVTALATLPLLTGALELAAALAGHPALAAHPDPTDVDG